MRAGPGAPELAGPWDQQGLRSFDEVETVVVEQNGGITIVRKPVEE